MQPIINYASEVFCDSKMTPRMESLHTTYLKRALGVKMQTSNLAILGETGRHPWIATQEKLVLFYWLKIKTTPLTNPLRIVNEKLYRFSNADHITWCTYVRDLLISIGLENIWMGQDMEISVENVDLLKLP